MTVKKAIFKKVDQVAGQAPVAPARNNEGNNVTVNPDVVVRGTTPKAPDSGMTRRVGGMWAQPTGSKKDAIPAHVQAAYEFIAANWAKGGDAQASVGEQLATKIVMGLNV